MPEPDLKRLRRETRGWRPKGEGGGAVWWIIGALVLLWLFNGGPR